MAYDVVGTVVFNGDSLWRSAPRAASLPSASGASRVYQWSEQRVQRLGHWSGLLDGYGKAVMLVMLAWQALRQSAHVARTVVSAACAPPNTAPSCVVRNSYPVDEPEKKKHHVCSGNEHRAQTDTNDRTHTAQPKADLMRQDGTQP